MDVHLVHHVTRAVLRRAAETTPPPSDDPQQRLDLPSWSWIVFLVNIVVFLPLALFVNYSLKTLYPVFAIIEDENPPAYEPLALDPSNPDDAEADVAGPGSKPTGGRAGTVSSSLFAINRILRSQGGSFFSNFRGLACYVAQTLFTWLLVVIFSAVLDSTGFYSPIATLLAALSLVQFSTAWIHIVISYPSERRFWKRLPPFRRTFDATWKPVSLFWASYEVQRWFPVVLALVLDVPFPRFGMQNEVPENISGGDVAKLLVLLVVYVLISSLIVIPAYVVLVRVQASLLPPEEDAIIPFDRSFQGSVQTALVGGRGYATISEAWNTFSKTAWRRLIFLYIKLIAVSLVGALFTAGILLAESYIMVPHVFNGGKGHDDL